MKSRNHGLLRARRRRAGRLFAAAVICALAAGWYVVSERARTQPLGQPIAISIDVDQGRGRLDQARMDMRVLKGRSNVRATVNVQAKCDANDRTHAITLIVPQGVALHWVTPGSDGDTAVRDCEGGTAFASANFEMPADRVLRRLGAGSWYFDVTLNDLTTVKFHPIDGNLTALFTLDRGQRLDDVYGSPFMSTPAHVMWMGHGSVRAAGTATDPTLQSRTGVLTNLLLLVIGGIAGALAEELLRYGRRSKERSSADEELERSRVARNGGSGPSVATVDRNLGRRLRVAAAVVGVAIVARSAWEAVRPRGAAGRR